MYIRVISPIKRAKFTTEQAIKAQRGVEAKLHSFFNLGARWVRGW